MAWKTRWSGGSPGTTKWATGNVPSATEFNDIGDDIRTWGDNVDAGGYQIANLGTVAGNAGVLTVTGKITASSKGHLLGTASGSAVAPANTDANILLYNASSTNWAGVGCDTNGSVWFRTGTSGTPDPRLAILFDGKIGIGTPTPGKPLEIAGSAAPSIKLRHLPGSVGDNAEILFATFTLTDGSEVRAKQKFEVVAGGLGEISFWNWSGSGSTQTERLRITGVGLLKFVTLPPIYANNAAAITGGLVAGEVYRDNGNPDKLCVVH